MIQNTPSATEILYESPTGLTLVGTDDAYEGEDSC